MKTKFFMLISILCISIGELFANTSKIDGALPGEFFVSPTQKVYFSKGNLQYLASNGTWRFAENQYDYIGSNNKNASKTYSGWIDVFGYGTSGWSKSGAIYYQPWDTQHQSGKVGGYFDKNLAGEYANADWGVFNKISNGGNTANVWRTLSQEEWEYVITNYKWTIIKVSGIKGLIILPNDFKNPLSVTIYYPSYSIVTNGSDKYYSFSLSKTTSLTQEQFNKLQDAGVVFLPYGGYRYSSGMMDIGTFGNYWTSTAGKNIWFTSSRLYYRSSAERWAGLQVRLVFPIGTQFPIKFVDADGTQIGETQIVKGGENATPPTPPTREGYTFVGWIGAYTNVKSDATIYASYSRNNELSTTQQGSLPGLFSVAPDKQVYFSQGNLQYMGATQTWRFAENQYDTVGIFNNNISSSYNGWIDLFGWGTSGWNSGAKEYQPYSTSTTDADYYPGNASGNDLTGPYMNADWGIYNAIYNGGNKAGLWRTLTQEEWLYLYSDRANADSKHAYATINGIGGYILLPDNWILPNGLTFDASGTNANQYTKEQWKLMEQNGAVFLPTAGYRDGLGAKGVLKLGDYWLSSSYDADNACRVFFRSDKSPESYPCELRHYGFSVRLVGHVTTHTIIAKSSDLSMGTTSGSGTYNYGESVQISAIPNGCFHFTQWSDGNTDNPRTVTVNSDKTYTAIFQANQHTITVKSADENQGTVTIEVPTPSQGIGIFSVSATKQVTFSPGNLQYTQSTDTWSFAENQYDYIGTDNVIGGTVSSSSFGDSILGTALADKVDLFGLSTSTTNFGVSISIDSENDYSGSFIDWGTNKIGNDALNTWRTLTYEEWNYLCWVRPNYSELCGVAQVNGVNGLVFLPDNWVCPSGVTFKSGFHSNRGVDYYVAYQSFTAEQWAELESAGAVFLPAVGLRSGTRLKYVQCNGDYWSATEDDISSAYYLYFYSDGAHKGDSARSSGRSVRLVKDLM